MIILKFIYGTVRVDREMSIWCPGYLGVLHMAFHALVRGRPQGFHLAVIVCLVNSNQAIKALRIRPLRHTFLPNQHQAISSAHS